MIWPDEHKRLTQSELDREVERACAHLSRRDPVMRALIGRHGTYRLKAAPNYFRLMAGTIVSQQLSTKAARTIFKRLCDNIGGTPTPSRVLAASEADLRSAGLSASKAQFLRNLATEFSTRRMGPKTFGPMNDREVMDRLCEIKGVGEWSAHMFLMFALLRLDIFPIGDLGLRNAMKKAYRLRKTAGEKRLIAVADKWKPYRTIGSLYMWKSYDE